MLIFSVIVCGALGPICESCLKSQRMLAMAGKGQAVGSICKVPVVCY